MRHFIRGVWGIDRDIEEKWYYNFEGFLEAIGDPRMSTHRKTLIKRINFDSWQKETLFSDKLDKQVKQDKRNKLERADSKWNHEKRENQFIRLLKDN